MTAPRYAVPFSGAKWHRIAVALLLLVGGSISTTAWAQTQPHESAQETGICNLLLQKYGQGDTSVQLVHSAHPVLRQAAAPFDPAEITQPSVQNYIDQMIWKMNQAGGVGIAAPQLGDSIAVVIVKNSRLMILPSTTMVLINPRILAKSTVTTSFPEGCLSLPGRDGVVSRPRWVEVEYYDRAGIKHQKKFVGWGARVVQHEIDHLNGVLFIDY